MRRSGTKTMLVAGRRLLLSAASRRSGGNLAAASGIVSTGHHLLGPAASSEESSNGCHRCLYPLSSSSPSLSSSPSSPSRLFSSYSYSTTEYEEEDKGDQWPSVATVDPNNPERRVRRGGGGASSLEHSGGESSSSTSVSTTRTTRRSSSSSSSSSSPPPSPWAREFSTERSNDDDDDDHPDRDHQDDTAYARRSTSPPGGPRRVWKSPSPPSSSLHTPSSTSFTDVFSTPLHRTSTWTKSVDDASSLEVRRCLDRITEQERQGGRMRQSQMGVVRTDPGEDMRLMIENYTVPALASALRDREDVLQLCASLLADGELDRLAEVLRPFERRYVEMRRRKENVLDLTGGFGGGGGVGLGGAGGGIRGGSVSSGTGDAGGGGEGPDPSYASLEMLRKGLSRMPRRVGMAHQRRAAVVLPLCDVNGVPCVLFEKRSRHLRAHPDEVCLPGGMVSVGDDKSIVSTCLREMGEEIGGLDMANVVVLGVLRCNWGEVHHLVGVAVTPVVCYIGEISDLSLTPNPDEVAEVFTVPLSSILDRERWVHREGYAPIFTGGPHLVWGLTGYIVERFLKDVMAGYNVELPPDDFTTDGQE